MHCYFTEDHVDMCVWKKKKEVEVEESGHIPIGGLIVRSSEDFGIAAGKEDQNNN